MSKSVVHKYRLEDATTIPEMHSIQMPIGADILHADLQHGEIVVWAVHEVEFSDKKEERLVEVIFTGQKIDWVDHERRLRRHYLNTVQLGPLVLHIFEHRKW